MALDLEAIRRKIAQLEGKGNGKNGQKFQKTVWFKTKAGEYTIRILPFKTSDGQPFKEIWNYQNIGSMISLPTLKQYGERDPFEELIVKLRENGSAKSLEMAKKLYPKMRVFAPVLVRGEEEKGPQVWGFGKTMYQKLLGLMLDADYGDVTDAEQGYDLKISVTVTPGKIGPDYSVTPRPKPSPISKDKKQTEQWLANLPDLDNLFKKRTYEEMSKLLEDYLAGTVGATPSAATGTERTGAKPKATQAATSPAKPTSSADNVVSKAEAELDDVFNDLLDE